MTVPARIAEARARRQAAAAPPAPHLRLVEAPAPTPAPEEPARRRVDPRVLAASLLEVVHDPSAGPRRVVLTEAGLVLDAYEAGPRYTGPARRYVGRPCVTRLLDRKSGQEVAVYGQIAGGGSGWLSSDDAVLSIEPEPDPGLVDDDLARRANRHYLLDTGSAWHPCNSARRIVGGPVVASSYGDWWWAPPRATYAQTVHAPRCPTEREALTALCDYLDLPAGRRPDWLDGRRPDWMTQGRRR